MSNEVKRQYLARVPLRYLKGNKKQKTLILDEFCQVCQISRKLAIKLICEEESADHGFTTKNGGQGN